jgi:ABC-type glutathione transport system ATPase component
VYRPASPGGTPKIGDFFPSITGEPYLLDLPIAKYSAGALRHPFFRVNKKKLMTNHIIATQDLTVFYGSHCDISDVNLSVEKGEVFGLLGPNGAGKTTIQRVLMDVIRPIKGHLGCLPS